jgi:importin-9
LFALGRYTEEIISLIQKEQISFEYIFSQVVADDMKCDALPYLQGRALWFTSRFASHLPSNMSETYMSACVNALRNEQVNFAIRIFAMKAVRG